VAAVLVDAVCRPNLQTASTRTAAT